MTLGEKIAAGRKSAGLTQDQLAKRLHVSRAAVAKWETDAGMPDVANIKSLAELFCVSMEDLLEETTNIHSYSLCRPITLDHTEHDTIVRSHFPDAYHIHRAILRHGLSAPLRCLNVLTFGLLAAWWRTLHHKEFMRIYYFVDDGDRQLLVTMEDTFLITTPLPCRIYSCNVFLLNGKTYILTGQDLMK